MSHRAQRQVSAGGVITRFQDGRPQVCLIHRRQDGRLVWALPKGHVESGEALKTTAMREVREETGLVGECVKSLGSITYGFTTVPEQTRYVKRVHFYLLRYRQGDTRDHDHEVDDAVWLPLDEALARLNYENERKVLLKARRYLRNFASQNFS